MSYTVGKSHAKKHPYRIFVRSGQTKETFTTDEQVLAIVGYGMSAGLTAASLITMVDSATDGALIDTVNQSYGLDNDDADGELYLDDLPLTGSAGDIIIINLADNSGDTVAKIVTITDDDNVDTILTVIGDYAVFVSDGSKWSWLATHLEAIDTNSVVNTEADLITTFKEIGACKEKPSITGSEGEEFMSNTADSITISENLEVAIEDTQVNALNYAYLRSLVLANNGQVDFAFVDTESVGESAFVYDMIIKALPLFVGNDLNVMSITAKKEAGNLDNHFALHNE